MITTGAPSTTWTRLPEITKLIPPPGWVSSLDMDRTSVQFAGEMNQAEGLVKTLDNSPLFERSEFAMPITRTTNGEAYRVKTMRSVGLPPARQSRHTGTGEMSLQEREKKLLIVGAILGTLMVGYWAFTGDAAPAPVAAVNVDNIPAAELRLKRLRSIAATVPAQQEALKKAMSDLGAREKGLIQADTAAQAQAQLLQILRKISKAQTPGIDLRNSEIGPVKAYTDSYGEVTLSLSFDARIEQLVQFLSDITAQHEIIGVNEVRMGPAAPKEKKIMPVR